jgi:hypothetical protein
MFRPFSRRYRQSESVGANGFNRAPGTIHACKRFIPEKVYLTAGEPGLIAAILEKINSL